MWLIEPMSEEDMQRIAERGVVVSVDRIDKVVDYEKLKKQRSK